MKINYNTPGFIILKIIKKKKNNHEKKRNCQLKIFIFSQKH